MSKTIKEQLEEDFVEFLEQLKSKVQNSKLDEHDLTSLSAKPSELFKNTLVAAAKAEKALKKEEDLKGLLKNLQQIVKDADELSDIKKIVVEEFSRWKQHERKLELDEALFERKKKIDEIKKGQLDDLIKKRRWAAIIAGIIGLIILVLGVLSGDFVKGNLQMAFVSVSALVGSSCLIFTLVNLTVK